MITHPHIAKQLMSARERDAVAAANRSRLAASATEQPRSSASTRRDANRRDPERPSRHVRMRTRPARDHEAPRPAVTAGRHSQAPLLPIDAHEIDNVLAVRRVDRDPVRGVEPGPRSPDRQTP